MLEKDKIRAIVIGGSAGSFPVVTHILEQLPRQFSIPLIFCLHRLKHIKEGFVEALETKSKIPVKEPFDKEKLKAGFAYLAPANYHMSLELALTFALSTEEMVNFSRPSIDITFESCGMALKNKGIGIILSGANHDGALGIKKMQEFGCYTIVQQPSDAKVSTMPNAALGLMQPDKIISADEISRFINALN